MTRQRDRTILESPTMTLSRASDSKKSHAHSKYDDIPITILDKQVNRTAAPGKKGKRLNFSHSFETASADFEEKYSIDDKRMGFESNQNIVKIARDSFMQIFTVKFGDKIAR